MGLILRGIWFSIFIQFLCISVNGQAYFSIIAESKEISDGEEKINFLKSRSSEVSDIDSLAFLYLDIANNYFDYVISIDSAITYCDNALEVVGGQYDPYQNIYAEAHYLKGFFYRKWDKYELSLEALEKVIDSGNEKYLFPAKVQLGKLYKDRGEFNIAFEHYDDALKIADNDWSRRIRVYEYISFAYSVMGTKEGARNSIIWLDSLEAGLKILNDPKYNDFYQLTNFNKSAAYFELGEIDKAKFHVDKAETLLNACCEDPDFMGLIIEMQGGIAMKEGDFKTGIEKLKAGLNLFQYSFDLTRSEGLAGTYAQIAEAYLKWGKPDSAFVYNEKAIYDRVYGLNNAQNDQEKTFEQMLFANGEKNYLINDFRRKGEIFEALSQEKINQSYIDSALSCYLLAEDILDAMSTFHFDYNTKAFWRQNAKDLYQEIIRLSYQIGDERNAFIYSEKSKYVILEEHLKKSNIDAYATDITLIREYQHTLGVITTLEEKYHNRQLSGKNTDYFREQILELRQEEEDQLLRIRKEHPEIFQNIYSWQKPNIEKLMATLKANDEEFFSYFVHDSTSYLFHIHDEELTIIPLPPQKEIENKVLEFRDFILENKAGSAEVYQQLAYSLYQMLFPVNIKSETRELVIVPDGVLSILPFSILTDKIDAGSSFKDMNYLFRSQVINMQLNAKAYLANTENNSAKEFGRAIAIAPTFNTTATVQVNDTIRSGLNNLEGAVEEIKYVKAATGARIFTNGFGEKSFYEQLKTNPSIIHLSTHALINDTQPEWSKLIMSKTKDTLNDDYIHLFELKNKSIHSDLVVLSACDTRTGKYLKGEGVSSLGIALNYAGSPNTVNTLWPIQDETSVYVMRNFYDNLKNGVPKNVSLQQAKTSYLQSQPDFLTHPYYWAGYVYYGNNLPLVKGESILSWSAGMPVGLVVLAGTILGLLYFWKKRTKKSY